MKKSTQWDLVAIFALFLGFSMLMAMVYSGLQHQAARSISPLIKYYGNPFIAIFAVAFSFLCFAFSYLEGKKEGTKPKR